MYYYIKSKEWGRRNMSRKVFRNPVYDGIKRGKREGEGEQGRFMGEMIDGRVIE